MVSDSSRLSTSRRQLLKVTGATAAASALAGVPAISRRGLAQDATPAASPVASPVASPAVTSPDAGVVDGDWPTFGYDFGQTRNVPYTQFTKDNVKDLGIVWSIDFQAEDETIPGGNQSYPIVVDGTIYVTTTFSHVFAIDGATGEVKWHWQPENIGFFKNFGVSANRGVAVGDGHVFVMTLDMRIYKIDQETGELVQDINIWDVVPEAKPEYGYYESTAPIYYDGVLYFGSSGSDNGVRGFMMAIRGEDMTPAWPDPFWTVPPDGQDWRSDGQNHGGGAPWMPASIDTETGILYFVTGNPSPDFFGAVRPGNNPNTNSIIAVDAKSGEQVWVAQSITRDLWDYDMAAPPVLFTAEINGEQRKVVAEGSKAGQWWCWDAATGEVIYDGVPFATIDHPEPTAEGVLVYPGILGGSNYAPQSYDPGTNYYLICNIEYPSEIKLTTAEAVEARGRGDVDFGGAATFAADVAPYGTYVAIDMASGEIAYSKETPGMLRGGFTTTATSLGFYGGTTAADANLHAIDIATGDDLWTFGVGDNVQSAPSIYVIDGTQYLAVTVGGSGSKLIAFRLGGDQTQIAPPPPPSAEVPEAPTDPADFLMLNPDQNQYVTINLVGGYDESNGGLNFNGYSKGDATITIPTGWKVALNLWNKGVMPHSVVLTEDGLQDTSGPYTEAIQMAYTPDPEVGFTGDQVQNWGSVYRSVQMSVPGTYVLLCAVPGHAPAGMWLYLMVDDAATEPTLTAPDGTVYPAK